MDQYIAQLEDELNKLRQEKSFGADSQKVEELEVSLRDANIKITLLQGQLEEAEARATADQVSIFLILLRDIH